MLQFVSYWKMFSKLFLRYLLKNPLIIIQASCFIAFTLQIVIIANNQINPSQTISHLEERSLDSIEFPVLFKICIKPAFNIAELHRVGYDSIWAYFTGQSSYNKSVYGWGGHHKNGSSIASVAGLVSNFEINYLFFTTLFQIFKREFNCQSKI